MSIRCMYDEACLGRLKHIQIATASHGGANGTWPAAGGTATIFGYMAKFLAQFASSNTTIQL